MKRIWVVALAAALAASGQKTDDAERLLAAAKNTELVDGNLPAAIEQYRKASRSSNRAVAAQALLRMAECHSKLGDAEAKKIYERVVREYGDQKEAVTTARARLGVARPELRAKGDRAVWTGRMVDMFGRVSPDGRLITFVDWDNGRLMVHDVVTNADRELTPAFPRYVQNATYSTISRDGKQVAYNWQVDKNNATLRIAAFQGNGISAPRQVFAGGEHIRFLSPFDWSPDGKWIAAVMSRTDGTSQIALIAAADGSLRVLKSLDWRGPGRLFFSQDGRYIAYDLPVGDGAEQRDLFLLAVDGSREIAAVAHPADDSLMGWSPDGKQLLFTSDRTGSVGLWALSIVDGKPEGAPEVLRDDVGLSSFSLGLTAAGSLYIYKNTGSRDVRIAPLDLEAGTLTGPPRSFTQGYVPLAAMPNWSPDGKRLAYQACDGHCIAIRSVETGEVRRLTRLMYARNPRWSPDGRKLLTAGRDSKGRDGVFLIDPDSGEFSPVFYTPRFLPVGWSKDGSSLYYNAEGAIRERNLVSGVEREIARIPQARGDINLSPDGRYLTAFDRSTTPAKLLVVPVDGTPSRELLRLAGSETWGPAGSMAWTPDSRGVIATKKTKAGTELVLAPLDGSPARKLGIDANLWTRDGFSSLDQGFSISPDGRSIAFLMGKRSAEVWALENLFANSGVSR